MYTNTLKEHRSRLTALLLIAICTVGSASAQQFTGMRLRENGVLGNIYNPGLIVDPDYTVRANGLSVSAYVSNNAYKFTRKYLFESRDNIPQENVDFEKSTKNNVKNGGYNIDWIGPSASFHFEDHYYVGFFTRMRQVGRLSNLDNGILQLSNTPNPAFLNRTITQENMRFDMHSWAELGFSYGRAMLINDKHTLIGGVSGKLLYGISAASIHVNNLKVNMSDSQNVDQLSGEVVAIYSDNIQGREDLGFETLPNFNERSSKVSFGIDVGFVYEYRPGSIDVKLTPYKLRAAIAITDIGSIKYMASPQSRAYDIDGAGFTRSFLKQGTNETMDQYISRLRESNVLERKSDISLFRMSLPTAVRGNIDWNIRDGWYVNADMLVSMLSSKRPDVNGAGYITSFGITPRYENKWASVGLPISYNFTGNFNAGLSFRAGPVVFGSGSILTSLASKRIANADAYIGIQYTFKGDKPINLTD